MKKIVENLDGSPNKRLYLSIIADYTPELSIFELIDNSIDSSKGKNVLIDITLNEKQSYLSIKDNAGGVKKEDMKLLISPGGTSNSGDDETIGVFGVGSKRGVVSVGENIKITSRTGSKDKTYQIEYDKGWIEDDTLGWEIPLYELDSNITEETTLVEVSKLYFSAKDLKDLGHKLGKVYGKIIQKGIVEIKYNGNVVSPIILDSDWAYPKGFLPKELSLSGEGDYKDLKVLIRAGLKTHGSADGKYGVTFFGNDRLICENQKNQYVGYETGKAGNPHPMASLCNVIVYINGPSKFIPWNSSKSGINYQNPFYEAFLRDEIISAVTNFTKLSRTFSKTGRSKSVAKCTTGSFEKITGKVKVKDIFYLNIPKTRVSRDDMYISSNNKVISSKPWVRGIIEGVIAGEVILKNNKLTQKNRIALFIFDSTLEIALKEYFINVVSKKQGYGKSKQESIIGIRADLEKELQTRSNITNVQWGKINYFYKLRCDLLHSKANMSIVDKDILDFAELLKQILSKLFLIKF